MRLPEGNDHRMLSGSSLLDWKTWVTSPAYILVFLVSVFPMIRALVYVKAFLLAAIITTVGVVMLKTGRTGLHLATALWTVSLSVLGFFFVLEGFFAGAPGAENTLGVYAVYPIIYLLLIAGVRNERILTGLVRTFIIAISCIAAYSIVYLLIETNVLPPSRYFELMSLGWEPQMFVLDEGYLGMQIPGLNSLPFLVPFSLAVLMTCLPRIIGNAPVRRISLWTAALLGLAAVALSGRRALFLVTLMAPFLTLLFQSFQPQTQRNLTRKALARVTACGILAVVVLLVCLNAAYGIGIAALNDRFSAGFDFSPTTGDNGANERREQYHALIAGWMENPILGAGHGAPAFGSIRSQEHPWSYELCYVALLYQTGLLGVAAYTAGIFWIYWMGARVIRAGGYLSALMVSSLVGMTSILIANATNPYLTMFDGMWPIFFPLAVINFSLLRSPRDRQFASA